MTFKGQGFLIVRLGISVDLEETIASCSMVNSSHSISAKHKDIQQCTFLQRGTSVLSISTYRTLDTFLFCAQFVIIIIICAVTMYCIVRQCLLNETSFPALTHLAAPCLAAQGEFAVRRMKWPCIFPLCNPGKLISYN